MMMAILMLFVFAVVLLAINYKSKYTWMFVLVAISIDILMFGLILFVGKVSSYHSVWFFEDAMYAWINRRKIGFYEIVNLINVGVAIYMSAMWMYINFLYSGRKLTAKRIAKKTASFLPICAFLYINSSSVCRKIHAFIYSAGNDGQRHMLLTGLEILRWINYFVIAFYILYPIVKIFLEYGKTNILYKKRKMIVITVTLGLMDVFFVYMLYMSTFGFELIDLTNLLKFNNVILYYSPMMYTVIPFIVLVVFYGTIALFMHFRVLERVDFFQKTTISKRTHFLFSDIRPIFHSWKNVLISLTFLGESIKENYGTPEGYDDLCEMISIIQTESHRLSNLLNVFNNSQININEIDLADCIDRAIEYTAIDKKIVDVSYNRNKKSIILGDSSHITRMFENMLSNAIEAMENRENKKVEIFIENESDWICVLLRDNGCGIAKKNIRKIFKPLFSTKHTSKSWGIGLSYVCQVLRAHNGLIFVSSKVNKYTEFQILLPTVKEINIYE